ncbi:MC/SLC25 family protein, partial [Klebsiella pneumoniae]|uniref:MC/SLC25 family protein n=1 Tax=Klebsiella pneumoniae TaxID=573 RepID=UPI003EE40278
AAVGTDAAGTAEEPTKEDGIVDTLKRVYNEEGPLALYTGLTPELTKGALSSALMLMIKEKIQTYITFMLILASMKSED